MLIEANLAQLEGPERARGVDPICFLYYYFKHTDYLLLPRWPLHSHCHKLYVHVTYIIIHSENQKRY